MASSHKPVPILFVVTKLELGGAQKHVLDALRCLDRGRFTPYLLTAREGPLVREAQAMPGVTVFLSPFLDRRISPWKDARAVAEAMRLIRRHSIRIVHTHSSKAGVVGRIAASLSGVPAVAHTVHGWSFYGCRNPLVRASCVALEGWLARGTSALVCVSEYDREEGLKAGIGSPARYSLLRYGVDCAAFAGARGNVREELGIPRDALVVGSVACLKPQKMPEDFLRLAALVCRRVPNAVFLLAGGGDALDGLRREAEALGLGQRVILAGWRTDIPALLASMDVFVLTSLWEGMPIAALEAVAAMRPVVATHTGGISEVIEDGVSGFLLPRRDMQGMAVKVERLLADPGLRGEFAREARLRMGESFSPQRMSQGLHRIYESLSREVCHAS